VRRDTRAREVMCATDAPDHPSSSTVTTAALSSRERCISDTCTRGEEDGTRVRALRRVPILAGPVLTAAGEAITRPSREMHATERAGRTQDGVCRLHLQARISRTRKKRFEKKRLVVQLRLQARGRSARGGLAGPSRACKRGFGLTLPRAGGERHCARGRVASNRARARGAIPREGGGKPAIFGR
jgi:hypothetical protein